MYSSTIEIKHYYFDCVLDETETAFLDSALRVFKTTKKFEGLCPAEKDVINDLLMEINNFKLPF